MCDKEQSILFQALSKHGKVFGGNLMIAVIPCIEKNIMEYNGKENVMDASDISMKLSTTSSKTPIRPLTAAYQAASSTHQVKSLPVSIDMLLYSPLGWCSVAVVGSCFTIGFLGYISTINTITCE